MNINKEYLVLLMMLNQLTESHNIKERRRIEQSFRRRLKKFKTHIDEIDTQIEEIAAKAVASAENKKTNNVKLLYELDRMMDAYRDLQYLEERKDD